ncbi:MAG: hypothetical protein NTY98_18675 [Verrucomicrobia bacterium]|nr:hypothetical protein [Verrucomicrobiota bacterium]
MPTSLSNFKSELQSAVLDLLWRQWSCIGAGLESNSSASLNGNIIDPEALLLATTIFGRQDARLFDEALVWLVRFGSLINVQRLKNLHKGRNFGDAKTLGAVAAFVHRHGKQPKWRILAQPDAEEQKQDLKTFFFSPDCTITEWQGEPDPDFEAHGWLRSSPRQKPLAMQPSSERLANVLLNLRALIGVSSRCEILLCLLTRPSARAAELARLTNYSPQSIQAVLGEMTLSGKVYSDEPSPVPDYERSRRGVSRRYYLNREDWSFLWPQTVGSPRWLPWPALFALSQSVYEALDTTENETLLSIRVRRVIEEHISDLTEGIGYHLFGYNRDMTGAYLLNCIAKDLPRLIFEL